MLLTFCVWFDTPINKYSIRGLLGPESLKICNNNGNDLHYQIRDGTF